MTSLRIGSNPKSAFRFHSHWVITIFSVGSLSILSRIVFLPRSPNDVPVPIIDDEQVVGRDHVVEHRQTIPLPWLDTAIANNGGDPLGI